MQGISIIKHGKIFTIKVTKKENGSNYNIFAHIFKQNDKIAIAGTSFKNTDTAEYIKIWALKTLDNFDINFLKN